MKLKVFFGGLVLLAVLMAISVLIFNKPIMDLLESITYWMIITVALGLTIALLIKFFPALKHIFDSGK